VNIGSGQVYKDASGNVGIGETSPAGSAGYTQLVIKGASGAELSLKGGTTQYGYVYVDSGGFRIINPQSGASSGTMQFSTSNTERMRIDSSGKVGINTTSPARTLHVKGGGVTTLANSNGALFTDASNAGVLLGSDNVLGYISGVTVAGNATADLVLQPFGGSVFINSTSGGGKLTVTGTGSSGWVQNNINSGTGTVASIVFTNGNGVVGSIQTSGSSTFYNTSSDYRLKNSIAPMTGALAKVALLKPCTYKWNVDGIDGQGFIAHELADVVPQCVTGEKDAVNAEGNPEYQGIDTSFLVATLTAAIQELKAIVDAQGAEIAALKGTP
jgi:hypothetical protein